MMRNPKRLIPFLGGLALMLGIFLLPDLPNTFDPEGNPVVLTHEGKAALGLFLLAGIWWVFEVIPVGATAITIAVVSNSVVKTGIAIYAGGWKFGRLVGICLGVATGAGLVVAFFV